MQKIRTKYGSVLVFSLIILFMGTVIALGMASTAVISRKNSSATGKSVSAFQIADSGAEIVLKKIKGQDGSIALSDAGVLGAGCSGSEYAGNIGSGKEYAVTFWDASGVQLNCSAALSQVDRIKSVGEFGQASRAIEVAIAAGSGCTSFPEEIEASDRGTATLATAADTCRDKSASDCWALPTIEDLSYFAGISGATSSYLWSRTSTGGNYFAVRLDDGNSTGYAHNSSRAYRCVRYAKP